jgi:hypothetical protein
VSDKARTNAKWTSSKKHRDNWDRVFNKPDFDTKQKEKAILLQKAKDLGWTDLTMYFCKVIEQYRVLGRPPEGYTYLMDVTEELLENQLD